MLAATPQWATACLPLAQAALDLARSLGASYADVRCVERLVDTVATRDGRPEGTTTDLSRGFGVRVLLGGAWGFASSSQLTRAEVERVTRMAIATAKASATVAGRPVSLGPPLVVQGRYETPLQEDPFQVPVETKLAILMEAESAMRAVPGVRVTSGVITCQRETKLFLSSEGSYLEQVLTETGCGIEATAVGETEVQTRSYPNSFGRHQATRGYEMVRELDLPGHATRIAEEAAALLRADPCPSTVTTLILDPTQLALQIHESIGHAIELDRVLGYEAAFAGTSFLNPGMRESFQYASPIVTVSADATLPGGLGTFGWDDEGVPAQRVPIIEAGRFTGFLSCRETAAQLGLPSGGMARADNWNRIPMVRMTNVNLEPGSGTLADIIADTDDGIYMHTNRSWSIDDKRVNFQFGAQIAWEVKRGRLGRMLKNPTYTGITPIFWAGCDAIAGASEWQIWGTPNCGKGQPMQVAHVGHGASPARFRQVQVGLAR
ncbi:MAG: TldD/PmbA family protein [Candidatus Sericytochromatia bacterium]|nr:TldD/PmbA family protein [Candidatus Sericytochromatia bacterium]